MEHFHQYLGTNHFYFITDHSALQWLRTTELKGRRARWILRLEPYNYSVIHRAERKHNNTDAMSRMYKDETPIFMIEQDDNYYYQDTQFQIVSDEYGPPRQNRPSQTQECITENHWSNAGQ